MGIHIYGAEAPGEADGPPPEGNRMIAFHHPSRAESERTVTTEMPAGSGADDLTGDDLREPLALARDSESQGRPLRSSARTAPIRFWTDRSRLAGGNGATLTVRGQGRP